MSPSVVNCRAQILRVPRARYVSILHHPLLDLDLEPRGIASSASSLTRLQTHLVDHSFPHLAGQGPVIRFYIASCFQAPERSAASDTHRTSNRPCKPHHCRPIHPGLVPHRSLPLSLSLERKTSPAFHPQDRGLSERASLPRALRSACISRRLLCASQRINTTGQVGRTCVAEDTQAHFRKWLTNVSGPICQRLQCTRSRRRPFFADRSCLPMQRTPSNMP